MPAKYYIVDVSAKLKSTRKVSYQCENCGGEFSYLFTLETDKWSDSTTAYSDWRERQRELEEKVFKQAKNFLDRHIDNLNSAKDYGYEKCPGCGYTQSWMMAAEASAQEDILWVTPMTIISLIFGVGSILIFVNGDAVLLLCVSSFILWLIIFFLFNWLGRKKIKDPNKNFGIVERKNTPIVVWSDPEMVRDATGK